MKYKGKRPGKAQRPILNRNVLESLRQLTKATAATDETEQGLRYLRHLIEYETSPERLAHKLSNAAKVQEIRKLKRDSES